MDSEENATSCSVCREIYSDPRCLACGHSFCLKCLKGVAGNKQTFACPICRFDVRLGSTNIDQLPKNFVLCNVIEAREKKHPSMCLDHNKSLDLFCQRCNVVICSKCLSMQHKGHSIEDIEIIFIERNKQYGAFLESTRHLGLITEEKRDAVKQLRISMEKNIDCISKTVENTFKKWNDALQKQHNAILSYLHQERDQKRQVFLEAERILEGSMTTVTGLDNEISKLRSKDTLYVVQQYGSIKARLEDTERKLLQEIETCLTPTDNLVLEVYAPWIEEAINNIKHIDMKHTQARSGRQKIAEIQEENFNLKRECEKLRITLQELEKRKTNEVENLEYLNQCLDSLVQRLYVHVVSGATTLPRTIEQPADIKPESSLAKRYKHAQEICAQFTKVRKELSATKQEMANKIKEYEQNYEKLRAEHQNFKTAYTALYERYNEANSDLSASKQEMANKIEENEQNYEKLRAEHQNLKTAYTTLQKRYNEDNAKHEKLTQKIQELKIQLQTEKDKWQRERLDWKYKYEVLEMTIKESTEHSCKISSPDDNVQSECAGEKEKSYIHEKEVRELKERVLTLEEVLRAVQDEADNISELKTKCEKKNTELLNRITILEQNLQKAQNERVALQGQNKSSTRQTKDFPKSFEDSQEKVGLPERRAKSQNSETVSNEKKKKSEIRLERDSLKEDNENPRIRLSEIAGSLVVDRNPSIADLTDEYRPSKLADSFSELYDNEWTDAFEEQKGTEKEAIQNLLTMLMEIHKKCQILGSKYLLALEKSSITLPGKGRKILEQTVQIPPIIRKFLLEIRKNFTPLIIQTLTKLFQGKFIGKTEKSFKDRKATSRYIEKCTHLCWYMAIKDPPVVLGPIPNEEDIVNKDLFSFYTNSGKHVHFCVWPPLFLHKGGSLLRKGVIQGK